MTERILLIDGDILAFRAVQAHHHAVEWEPNLWTYHVDFAGAKARMEEQVEKLRLETGADETILGLTSRVNFRTALLPTYKAHRKPKPPGYSAFVSWVEERFETCMKEGLEGDDVLGILLTSDILPGEKVLWSDDKDLGQIPGLHWRNGELLTVTPEQGFLLHVKQTLMGDAVDNYAGLKGYGPKTAEAFLRTHAEFTPPAMWDAVVNLYLKAGHTYDDFLVQARVARILDHTLFNTQTKEPILWTPPTS